MKEIPHHIIETQKLVIGYSHSKKKKTYIQENLNLSLEKGKLICLIGPNGCGKSTLIRTISGLQPPLEGNILINQKDLSTFNIKDKAKAIALVLTEIVNAGDLTARQIVELGRIPFTNWMGIKNTTDFNIINTSLKEVGMQEKADLSFNELSDGEKQRTMIAKALAQETPVIILDEATAHLDLPNRVNIMLLLKKLAAKHEKSILISTHELDLALQCADIIWLMTPQDGVLESAPDSPILFKKLEQLFSSPNFVFNPKNRHFQLKNISD